MRLDSLNRDITTSIPSEQARFTIEASPKAFQILSSNLYTDKPKAIIREICCNAYDAHVVAGCPDKPFRITLPSALSQNLIIRDYGPGLSHEAVMQLYTTYFGSDKTQSNDLIGGLGLGSKSPFSYVDTFSVVSRYGGVASTYTAFIDEAGFPNIVRMHEAPTDETGLEVIVPVKSSDTARFGSAALSVLQHFPVPPSGVQVEPPKYKIQGDGYGARARNYGENSKVIMGNVAYTIPEGETDAAGCEYLGKVYFHIFAKIGELDIAASRESLSLDGASRTRLHKMLLKIDGRILADIQQQIDKATSMFEALQIADMLMGSSKSISWRGRPLNSKFFRAKVSRYGQREAKAYWRSGLYAADLIRNGASKMPLIYWLDKKLTYRRIFEFNDIPSGTLVFKDMDDAAEVAHYFGVKALKISTLPREKRAVVQSAQAREPVLLEVYDTRRSGHVYWRQVDTTIEALNNDMDANTFWLEMDRGQQLCRQWRELANYLEPKALQIAIPRSLKRLEKHCKMPHIRKWVLTRLKAKFKEPRFREMFFVAEDAKSTDLLNLTKLVLPEQSMFVPKVLGDFIEYQAMYRSYHVLFHALRNGNMSDAAALAPTKPPTSNKIAANLRAVQREYPVISQILLSSGNDRVGLKQFKHYISLVRGASKETTT
jgi:hypothetical protein